MSGRLLGRAGAKNAPDARKVTPEAVLAVMDDAIATAERHSWPRGFTPVQFIAYELGSWVGVNWFLSEDNWSPNNSATARITSALRVLVARGLAVRDDKRPLYTVTAEGDAVLSEMETP